MAITYAQIPREQFRDLIPTFRNGDIIALMQPLVLLHQNIHSNGSLADRSGSDTGFRNLVLSHIFRADKIRGRVTYNLSNKKLAALTIPEVEEALKTELAKAQELDNLTEGASPAAGDTVVATTTQNIDVPWMFDGTDKSGIIRLTSELEPRFVSGPGYLVFGAINEAIVACTTCESRFNAQFLSLHDSTRIMGMFQRIVSLAMNFMGEANRLDVPEGVLASERPAGPASSPNLLNEANANAAPSNAAASNAAQ